MEWADPPTQQVLCIQTPLPASPQRQRGVEVLGPQPHFCLALSIPPHVSRSFLLEKMCAVCLVDSCGLVKVSTNQLDYHSGPLFLHLQDELVDGNQTR